MIVVPDPSSLHSSLVGLPLAEVRIVVVVVAMQPPSLSSLSTARAFVELRAVEIAALARV